jgi:prepilin-type N-terminal cleavage/methylation domain-containing protein
LIATRTGRRRASGAARGRRGFTLLEILAVLLLMGLMASLVLPNLGALSEQALRDEARRLQTELERARERALVTGVRHQLVIDLEAGEYWTEWEPRQLAEAAPPPSSGSDGPRVPMSPPERERRSFEPLPDRSGRGSFLENDIVFEGIEVDGGFADRGVLQLPFEADGSSQAARIVLARPQGDTLTLELLPLAESVRILDEDA